MINPFRFVIYFSRGAGGNSDSVFDVEKTMGTIIIAKPLDAERHSFYNLTVQSTDGTNTAYTQVRRAEVSISVFSVDPVFEYDKFFNESNFLYSTFHTLAETQSAFQEHLIEKKRGGNG